MVRVGRALALVVLLIPRGALAQGSGPASPVSEAEINARRLFAAGESAFDAERYESALAYFEEAYALQPVPGLLYNIGVSAERAGNPERAIEAFERYLATAGNARNRAEVEGRVRVLQRERDAHATETPEATPSAVDANAPETANSPAVASAATVPHRPSRAAGWAIVGGSSALAVTGVVLLGLGARDYSAVENASDGTAWSDIHDAHVRAPRLANAGLACGIAGVVGAAVGVVLVVRRDDDSRTDVALTGTGVLIRRTF